MGEEKAAPWQESRGSEREHEKERVDSTMKKGIFQGGKIGQARRASLANIKGSMSG